MDRTPREFSQGGRRWRALEAWRGRGGHGLLYFLPAADGEVEDDDRLDGRAALAPDERLVDLDEETLARRRAGAAPLTETERRFEAPDGRTWLVQSVGPVWAEEDVAGGLTGLLFTSLSGPFRRLSGPGGHAGRMEPEELRRRWREAAADGEEGGADGGAPQGGDGAAGPDAPGEGAGESPGPGST